MTNERIISSKYGTFKFSKFDSGTSIYFNDKLLGVCTDDLDLDTLTDIELLMIAVELQDEEESDD